MFMSIAISRVAPVLVPIVRESIGLPVLDEDLMSQEGFGAGVGRLVDKVGALVRAADREGESPLRLRLPPPTQS